jgi:death-on-curing protein
MIQYLNAGQIVELHDLLLQEYGGEEGGGHRGARNEGVEAVVHAVRNSYYETPQELAAAYAVYIIQGHVFMDGNKRAGSAAMLLFLEMNNIPVRTRARRRLVFVELQRRAESGASTSALVRWLAALI